MDNSSIESNDELYTMKHDAYDDPVKIIEQMEIIVPAMEIPSTFEVLKSAEVWIADTGATVHNTPHAQGLVPTRNPGGNDYITVGNGQQMKPTTIGTIKGTVTDRNGRAQMKVTLSNIVHILLS